MFSMTLLLLAHVLAMTPVVKPAVPHTATFEISGNKPFIRATINGSAPQWFILDTGCRGNSIIARESADRLHLQHGAEEKANVGAGAGADVGLSTANQAVRLGALGATLTVAEPILLTLGHVARIEGRRIDGLLGGDFLAQHVVEIDYAKRRISIHDPSEYAPPPGAVIIPVNLDTGWAVAEATITTHGGTPIPCRLIIDTGVRFTVALFQPFSAKHALHDSPGRLRDVVIGAGVGGLSRGDVARLDALTLGSRSFAQSVAVFSRDTSGIFSMDGPDGIVGGELLRRHRVTFDYAHGRMILEPYDHELVPFEFDMSGLFLAADPPDYAKIRILSVNAQSPAAEAGLVTDDEIVSIDGRRTPRLSLDQAREMLRAPVVRRLEIMRGKQRLRVRLEARRQV